MALGCANYVSSSICAVTMASDEVIEAAGYTAEIVLRHEVAHCNGWPKDHAGSRLWVLKIKKSAPTARRRWGLLITYMLSGPDAVLAHCRTVGIP